MYKVVLEGTRVYQSLTECTRVYKSVPDCTMIQKCTWITKKEIVSLLIFLFIGTIVLFQFLLGNERSIAFPKKELKVNIGFPA